MSPLPPYEPVCGPVEAGYVLAGTRPKRLAEWDRHVIVDVVHDGVVVPPELTSLLEADGTLRPTLRDAFIRERDWGAAAVAERLAHHLGLRGYHHAAGARLVADYNRFRGWTDPQAGHLGRSALFPPASERMTPEEGELALRTCFDPITAGIRARAREAFAEGGVSASRLLRITVHTYDDRAGAGHRRPKTSLIFTPFEYHATARIPVNVYPPVFPDRLAEFTADRALAYRMALVLEKHYLPVAVNSPYFLPLGGAEMRFQVWCFLMHLEEQVCALDGADAMEQFQDVWPLLLEVDRPWATQRLDADQEQQLEQLMAFIEKHHEQVVQAYRYSAFRPSAVEVEVRKDIIWPGSWQVLGDGREAYVPDPGALDTDEVDRVAAVMADGIHAYLTIDQPEKRLDRAR